MRHVPLKQLLAASTWLISFRHYLYDKVVFYFPLSSYAECVSVRWPLCIKYVSVRQLDRAAIGPPHAICWVNELAVHATQDGVALHEHNMHPKSLPV